ncbi:MAG TPA: ion transporter, partial [Wenzhouxiangella sp.]
MARWVEGRAFSRLIIALIIVNAIVLGLETSPAIMATIGPFLILINRMILAVFVFEISIKLLAHGGRFFRSGWNWFDFFIVGIALVP